MRKTYKKVYNKSEIIEKICKDPKMPSQRVVTKIINMYLGMLLQNIINGFRTIIPNVAVVQVRMHLYGDKVKPNYSVAMLQSQGKKVYPSNPHTPGQYAKTDTVGGAVTQRGVSFWPNKKIKKEINERLLKGHKYSKAY